MTRSLLRILCTLVLVSLGMVSPALAQEETAEVTVDRSATGGAQTLEDILARQQGLAIDDAFRRDDTGADRSGAAIADQLGTLGGASDPELWRALRYGSANVTVSTGAPAANIIIQDSGMRWLAFRDGDLRTYGGYLLLGMIGVLALFYLGRGKIRIDGPLAGKTIQRFKAFERFGHWLLGGSFILLGITGLLQLFGRVALIPYFGKDAFAAYAVVGKWIHNNVAWAFMIGLVWVTVTWISTTSRTGSTSNGSPSVAAFQQGRSSARAEIQRGPETDFLVGGGPWGFHLCLGAFASVPLQTPALCGNLRTS